ncbi:hypothetical protein BDZ97DRAFT_1876591 [Flammula alnicola]|nr:hypothetical protein BDZ97DRAFT_1876591 [Flammula alnicola]
MSSMDLSFEERPCNFEIRTCVPAKQNIPRLARRGSDISSQLAIGRPRVDKPA